MPDRIPSNRAVELMSCSTILGLKGFGVCILRSGPCKRYFLHSQSDGYAHLAR